MRRTFVIREPWEGSPTLPRFFAGLVLAALLALAPAARAQPMAGGTGMPNLAEIVGRALPDSGMPPGTVSVRVARKMPANVVAGVTVNALIKNAGGDMRRRTEKTDADGRAIFEGMAPGDEFHADVTVDGEILKTETFTMPAEGGAGRTGTWPCAKVVPASDPP